MDCTLHSEMQHREAKEIYQNHTNPDAIARAWAVFVLSHQSMFSILGNTWSISKERNKATQFNTKKQMFDEVYVKRLENTSVF